VHLAEKFPATAFTDRSLDDIAAECAFFPAYKVLIAVLETWHKEHVKERGPAPQYSSSLQEYLDERADNETYKFKIARRMADAKADWSDPEKVRATAAKIDPTHPLRLTVGRFFAALVRKHAPQNLGLLLPEWLDPNERG
jgi:hypothetical protein